MIFLTNLINYTMKFTNKVVKKCQKYYKIKNQKSTKLVNIIRKNNNKQNKNKIKNKI